MLFYCIHYDLVILYYTILYYTILYYTILYCTILYYTILYYTILYYIILYYFIYIILSYILLYHIISDHIKIGKYKESLNEMHVRRLHLTEAFTPEMHVLMLGSLLQVQERGLVVQELRLQVASHVA